MIKSTASTPARVTDIRRFAPELVQDTGGIWHAPQHTAISYPEEGNRNCLALEADSFWFVHRSRCIEGLMARYAPGGTVFDIGGGNGYVALSLARAGIDTVLVEPGETGAQNARRRGVQTVVCATLQDAGFLPGSLPAAGLFDVLEHIADERAFLRDLVDRLVPGGRVYLTVPAYRWLWSADDDYAGHYRRYTLAGLERVLRSVGLQPEFGSYFFGMLPAPIFLMRAVPTWLGLRKQNAWDSYHKEHSSRSGWTGKVLEAVLQMEYSWLRHGRALPAGGSCLMVARKVV